MKYFGISGEEVLYLGDFDYLHEAVFAGEGRFNIVFTEDELKTLRYEIDKALDTNFDAPVEGRELVVIDESTVLWRDETYVAVPTTGICGGCSFEHKTSEFCGPIMCRAHIRTDKRNVIFIKKEQSCN